MVAQLFLSGAYAVGLATGSVPDRFNFDLEANLPTWWSSALLLAIAGLCAVIAAGRHLARAPHVRWWIACAGFVGLSLEEVAQIHEQVGVLVGGGREKVSVWPLVYMPVLVVGVAVLVRCLRDLHGPPRTMVAAGLGLYCVTVAAELTAISGDLRGPAEVLIEENAEALGATLILLALASTALELIGRAGAGLDGMRRHPSRRRRFGVRALLAIAAVQVALTAGFVAVRLSDGASIHFDLGGEGNVPTWWSSTLLLAVAGVCAVLAATAAAASTRRYWAVAAAVFALFSMQDVARVHKAFGVLDDGSRGLVLLAVAAGAAVGALGLLVVARCLSDLPLSAQRLAFAGLAGYLVTVVAETATAGDARRGLVEASVTENLQMAAVGVLLVALGGVASGRLQASLRATEARRGAATSPARRIQAVGAG
jgi:hypothetical protein